MIEGRGPAPLLCLSFVQGLPDTSYTTALAAGGREFLGWGVERYALADLFDALNLNTKATGNWKPGKIPNFTPFPRPQKPRDEHEPKKPVTVADLWTQLSQRR